MTDPERREAVIRATLSGLGFDLERKSGAYVVTDRRAALDLPGAMQPTTCQTIDAVIGLFSIEVIPFNVLKVNLEGQWHRPVRASQ
jgi:hypothetical protein